MRAARGLRRVGRASATPTAARSCTPARRRSRLTSTSLIPLLVAEQGKTTPRGPDSSCTRRPTRSSTTPGWRKRGARRLRRTGSTRASTVACCAGRSVSSRRSCRGTSRPRCCATSSGRRCCAATRWSPSRPTRRRSRRCALAEILTEAGPAAGRVQRRPRRRAGGRRGARHPSAGAQGGVHRLDADRRARRRAGRERLQAGDARARAAPTR